MSKKVAVVLAGCGFQDGSEIHESVLTLLYLDKAGVEVQCAAPNIEQRQVVNHLTGETTEEERSVLVESARISRGNIIDLALLNIEDYDAVVFPGGFGVALNSCDFALRGTDCAINPDIARCLTEAHSHGKVIGAICIAPVLVAKALGQHGIHLTIGNDPDTAAGMNALGCEHQNAATDEIIVDLTNKVVSTPAYMLATGIAQISDGIEKLVGKVLELS